MVAFMEAKHKERTEPHHHLAYLGAVPEARGQGRGSALLASVLERCDADRLPASLEATSTGIGRCTTVRFETLEELHRPGGGPPFRPMWRTGR
jgi:GNAT superfamily N-acetyltransferase